jgi:hypothetical protein
MRAQTWSIGALMTALAWALAIAASLIVIGYSVIRSLSLRVCSASAILLGRSTIGRREGSSPGIGPQL